jgi:hypothetical protein
MDENARYETYMNIELPVFYRSMMTFRYPIGGVAIAVA